MKLTINVFEKILTAPSEGVVSIKARLRLGEITLLLRWDGLWGWGDWGVRKLSRSLAALSSIAVVADAAHVHSSLDLDHTVDSPV